MLEGSFWVIVWAFNFKVLLPKIAFNIFYHKNINSNNNLKIKFKLIERVIVNKNIVFLRSKMVITIIIKTLI